MQNFNLKTLCYILFSLAAMHLLSGCVAYVASGAAATGQIVTDKRSSGKILDDVVIKGRITKRFFTDVEKRFSNVTTKVNEGRVLLTGTVPNQAASNDALQIVWQVKGVKEVINEIETADKRTVWQKSKDMMIASRIKSKYLLRRGMRSANYNVVVNDSVVYLFGIAENDAEKQVAADIARRVKGVKQVVNYVILMDDERRC